MATIVSRGAVYETGVYADALYDDPIRWAYAFTLAQTPHGTGVANPGDTPQDAETGIILTATPDPGYAFLFWSLNGQRFHTNPLHINIEQDLVASATFTPVAIPAPPPGRARCPFCHGGTRCVVCGGTGWVRA